MEGKLCQVKGSRTAFIKADAKIHLSNADGRVPLKSTATGIFISTVKKKDVGKELQDGLQI